MSELNVSLPMVREKETQGEDITAQHRLAGDTPG